MLFDEEEKESLAEVAKKSIRYVHQCRVPQLWPSRSIYAGNEGNNSVPHIHSSGKMIEWRLFGVKQHKYKVGLGWVTIWWVVLII